VKFGPDGAMYIVDFGQVLVDPAKPPPPYEFPTNTGMIWKVTQTALSARVPVGGVQTGAGGTATDSKDHTGELAALALAAGAALTAAGAVSLRRNRSRT